MSPTYDTCVACLLVFFYSRFPRQLLHNGRFSSYFLLTFLMLHPPNPFLAFAGNERQQISQQQFTVPAARAVGRVIPRSNSSPDPTSSSPPLGSSHGGGRGGGGGSGGGSGGGGGGGVVSNSAVATAPLDPPPPTSSDPLVVASAAVTAAAEWPLPREWGGSSGDGGGGSGANGGNGGGGTLDGSAEDLARNNVSVPVLGSVPLPSWSTRHIPPAVGQRQTTATTTTTAGAMGARAAATDSESVQRQDRDSANSSNTCAGSGSYLAGPGGSSCNNSSEATDRGKGIVPNDDGGGAVDGEGHAVVVSTAVVSSENWRRGEEEEDRVEGREDGNPPRSDGVASATVVRRGVVTITAPASVVLDGDSASLPSDARIVGDVRRSSSGSTSSPAATIKLLQDVENVITSAPAAANDGRGAPVAGRDGGLSSTSRESAAPSISDDDDDDDNGNDVGGGGQGRRRRRQQQRTQERRVEGQDLLRREGANDTVRPDLEGNQRRSDDVSDGGSISSGGPSPPTATPHGR